MISKQSIARVLKNDFIRKIFDSFLGKASYLLFTMFFSLVCSRLFGAEVFGQYTYGLSIVTILMIFAKAGFDNSIIFYIPKYGNKHVSLSFMINLMISVVMILGAVFFVEKTFVLWMLPLVWLLSTEQIFFGVYRATNQIKRFYTINGVLSVSLRILLVVLFYFFAEKNNVSYIIIAVYVSYIFANLYYFKQNKHMFGKVVYDKQYLKYSFSLVLAAIMWVAIDKVDTIMIGNMTNMENVGIYQISAQISNLIFMILVIFDTVFGPKISTLYHNAQLEELKLLYIKSTRILAVSALLLFIVMGTLSGFILGIFGEEFKEGQLSLLLRGFAQFINVAVGSVWLMLAMTGKPRFQIYANLLAFILNIVLNYLLIPKFGINGSAFASMVSVILVNIIGYVLVTKEFKLKVYKYF